MFIRENSSELFDTFLLFKDWSCLVGSWYPLLKNFTI